MHPIALCRAGGLALAALLVATGVRAQDSLYVQISRLADSYVDTPAGMGLLETAVAEAATAVQHADLAVGDSLSVDGLRRHAGHVLHALDPTLVTSGPAMGYGLKRAAAEAVQQIDLILATDSLPENVSVHATYIAAALADVVGWTDEAISVAERLQFAASRSEAAAGASRLGQLCRAIRYGRDANGDRVVSSIQGESGLKQAVEHMNLLKRGEGLTR
jgi:hypothetical protein